jgi:hypothetical protein
MSRITSTLPRILATVAVALTLAVSGKSQQPAPQQQASRYDVLNYRIEAQIIPDQHLLRAWRGRHVCAIRRDALRSL